MPAPSKSVFKDHWKAFYSGGVLSFARLATGFIRIKYIALALGTAGIGFLSQASQLQVLGVVLVSLSMSTGVINRMGAIGSDVARERRLLSTALTIHLVTSVLLVVAAMVFEPLLSRAVFGESSAGEWAVSSVEILAVAVSAPLAAIASSYLQSVFFGAGRYDLCVRASIWATLTGFAATMVLIARWGLRGAFWAIPVSSGLLFAWFLWYVRRLRPMRHLFAIGFDRVEALSLVRFSVVMMITAGLVPLTRLWLQSRIVARLGIDAIGILHVPFAMSAYAAPFLTNGLWGRMHPAVASLSDPRARHRELSAAVRLTVGLAAVGLAAMLVLQRTLVPLAFSSAFLPATQLIPAQLLGDYMYFIWFPFVVYALAASELGVFLVAWVGYSIVVLISCVALMPQHGLTAIPMGYGIGNGAMAVVSLAWLISKRMEGARFTLTVVAAGFVGVASEAVLVWLGRYQVVQGAILVAMGATAVAGLWTAHRTTVPADPIWPK